jgi:hypothetical protein
VADSLSTQLHPAPVCAEMCAMQWRVSHRVWLLIARTVPLFLHSDAHGGQLSTVRRAFFIGAQDTSIGQGRIMHGQATVISLTFPFRPAGLSAAPARARTSR